MLLYKRVNAQFDVGTKCPVINPVQERASLPTRSPLHLSVCWVCHWLSSVSSIQTVGLKSQAGLWYIYTHATNVKRRAFLSPAIEHCIAVSGEQIGIAHHQSCH